MKNLFLLILLISVPVLNYSFEIGRVQETLNAINWKKMYADYTMEITKQENTVIQKFTQKEFKYNDENSAMFSLDFQLVYRLEIANEITNLKIITTGNLKKEKHPDLLIVNKIDEEDTLASSMLIFTANLFFVKQAREDNWTEDTTEINIKENLDSWIYGVMASKDSAYYPTPLFTEWKSVGPFETTLQGELMITILDRSNPAVIAQLEKKKKIKQSKRERN